MAVTAAAPPWGTTTNAAPHRRVQCCIHSYFPAARALSTDVFALAIASADVALPNTRASIFVCSAWVAAAPPITEGNGVAAGSPSTYALRNGSLSSLVWALMSEVRLGRIPMPIRTSAIAEEPFLPDSGPFKNVRNCQAAFCFAGSALPLTIVNQL